MTNECPIDLIAVLTLERSKDRHQSLLGAAMHPLCGVPPDLIKFTIGIDSKDYMNMQDVADAAAEDGFGFVEEYALGTRTEYVQQTPASVAQIWGYARILRYLVETEQTGLILWDDKMITVPFGFFCSILEHLQMNEKPFYMWQLLLRGHPDEIGLEPVNIKMRSLRSELLFKTLVNGTPASPTDILIDEGIAGYDESIVFSPAGAQWMLKELEKSTDFYIFLDHFICIQMSKSATHAAKNGKGIYRPMEIGYKFVDIFRPMGTLTDWAHEDSPHLQLSRREINPQYLHL